MQRRPAMTEVKLVELIEDFDIYPRNDVSSTHVSMLCDAISIGDPVPPIVVDKKSKRIVDGFHRYRAYKRIGRDKIPAVWREYKSDAELFADAVRLNAAHGRAFDAYDRKRAILKLEAFGLSPQAISAIVHIPA